jgi:pimeloyl-ACP methyl ester carboxylesterase
MRIAPPCLPALTLLLAGCGAPGYTDDERATGLTHAPREPLVVSFGGFSSCADGPDGVTPAGTDRWARAEAVTREVTLGAPRWVRGCFDRAGRVHWITSAAPDTVQRTGFDVLAPLVRSVAERAGGSPVYLHGHSYGGWVAMHLAASLPASVQVRMLVTVDPISPAHCTPASYLVAAASPLTAPWTLAGCQRAPTDFSPGARRWILARLPDGAWRHYYQRGFIPLRASDFDAPSAHRRYDVSPFLTRLGGAHPSWNAHVGIDELSVVWHTFAASIANDRE